MRHSTSRYFWLRLSLGALLSPAFFPGVAAQERISPEPFPHLQGTRPLRLPTDILKKQYGEIEAYYLRRIAESSELRDQRWQPDFSSRAAYRVSLEPHRRSLEGMLGLAPAGRLSSSLTKSANSGPVTCDEVEISSPGEPFFRLLALTASRSPVAAFIVIPDATEAPEELLGLKQGQEVPGWVKRLLRQNAAVLVPATVQRRKEQPISEQLRGKDLRHILHRLGFVVGRTLVGLEVRQALSAAEYARSRFGVERLAVAGRGQGGMTALYAGALSELFQAVAVVDYFGPRETAWSEPVDRMLCGQIVEFGDAELAALIAPRPLVLSLQRTPARRELERARRFYQGLNRAEVLQAIDADAGLEHGIRLLSAGLSLPEPAPDARWSFSLSPLETRKSGEEDFQRARGFLDRLVERSEERREKRWGLLTVPENQREAVAERLRQDLAGMMGVMEKSSLPLAPATRLIELTDSYAAYEVFLDALPGLHAYGLLLIPRLQAGRPLPAVVCQHGLDGSPRHATGIGIQEDTPYHAFGTELAKRGYVVFAPYVTVPSPQDVLINRLVRQASLLGQMRTSVELLKLGRVIDFLQTLPEVDPERIGYYGLSYGGYSAIWMSPLEPRLKAVVISGHFNDWRSKITNHEKATSYLLHPDEDFYNWDVLHRFTHVELIAATWPRPVCIEYGTRDAVTPPEWHERAWTQVTRWAQAWDASSRIERVLFDGGHEVRGGRTYEFLDQYLKKP